MPDRWASNAAKLAIGKLLAVHEAELQPTEEAATIFLGDLITQNWEDTSPSDEDDAIGILEDSAVLLDCEFDVLAEADITRLHQNKSSASKPLEIPMSDAGIVDLDDEGSRGHKNEDVAMGTSLDAMDLLDGEFNGLAEEDITKLLRSLELKPLEILMRDAGTVYLDDGGSGCDKNGDDAIGTSEDSTDFLDCEFNDLAEEDSEKTLVNKIFESKSLESFINAESVVASDAESSIGPAIQYVNVEDEQETNAIIEPPRPRRFKGTEKPNESSMVNDEVDSVGKLDEYVTVAAHSLTDELTDVAELEDLAAQTKLLEVPGKLDAPMTYLSEPGGTGIIVDVKETMVNDEVDSVGKLDECVTVAAHSLTDELTDVAELEDLAAQTKLLEVPGKLDAPVTYLSDPGGTGIIVDVRETELYPENRHIALQSGDTSSSIRKGDSSYLTTSENCMQDDLHRAADEKTASLIQDHVKEELLVQRDEELVLDKSSETEGEDVKRVGDNGRTYSASMQLRGHRGWPRYINPADNSRRNRKDSRTTRPRWH